MDRYDLSAFHIKKILEHDIGELAANNIKVRHCAVAVPISKSRLPVKSKEAGAMKSLTLIPFSAMSFQLKRNGTGSVRWNMACMTPSLSVLERTLAFTPSQLEIIDQDPAGCARARHGCLQRVRMNPEREKLSFVSCYSLCGPACGASGCIPSGANRTRLRPSARGSTPQIPFHP